MWAIKTEALTKIFGGYKAVDNLSLKIPEGSVYGFLGPNGAGKTTTLRMLTGMTKPDGGSIELFGEKAVFGKPYKSSWIGVLPDVPDFYGWMTAEEFLILSGRIVGMPETEIKKQARNMLERVGLRVQRKKIRGFSRGMKQRLGIAQALLHKPKVVFMDEPTSALDPIGRKEILDLIADLKKDMTVFLSTHILADVERICDRVAVLDKGKILVEDDITSLKETFSSGKIILKVLPHQLEAAESLLREKSFIEGIQRNEDAIEIRMPVIEENNIALTSILGSQGIGIVEMMPQRADLEEIFVKVVQKR